MQSNSYSSDDDLVILPSLHSQANVKPTFIDNGEMNGFQDAYTNQFQQVTKDMVDRLRIVLGLPLVLVPNRSCLPVLKTSVSGLIQTLYDDLEKQSAVEDVRIVGTTASHIIDNEACPFFEYFDVIVNIKPQLSLLQNGQSNTVTNKNHGLSQRVASILTSTLTGLRKQEHSDEYTTLAVDPLDYLFRDYQSDAINESWVKVTLGTSGSGHGHKMICIKFVENHVDQYEFTVDSLQIIITPLLQSNLSDNPLLVMQSMSVGFQIVLLHLRLHRIYTKAPERSHGGCLLRYCHLIMSGYLFKSNSYKSSVLEAKMCTRFFIDFRTQNDQKEEIEHFMALRLPRRHRRARAAFLAVLHHVMLTSTICLTRNEMRRSVRQIARMRSEANQEANMHHHCVPVDLLFDDAWTLDQVFYGTHCFPPILQASALAHCRAQLGNSDNTETDWSIQCSNEISENPVYNDSNDSDIRDPLNEDLNHDNWENIPPNQLKDEIEDEENDTKKTPSKSSETSKDKNTKSKKKKKKK